MNSLIRKLRAPVFLALLSAAPLTAAEELAGILIVEISGLQNATGDVYIAVYDSDDTWLGDETFKDTRVSIAEALDGDLVRTELQLPLGQYAMTVFHDVDNDGELDTNFIGIPKEPIAMSNNAVSKFGPPKFEDAVFTLGAEPMIQSIIMKEL